jgi:hypothetical protein
MGELIDTYPSWVYYPSRSQPPAWVETFVSIVRDQRDAIESAEVKGLTSDLVLNRMSTGLAAAGYSVETGKRPATRCAARFCLASRANHA